jgi:hypothetical protein
MIGIPVLVLRRTEDSVQIRLDFLVRCSGRLKSFAGLPMLIHDQDVIVPPNVNHASSFLWDIHPYHFVYRPSMIAIDIAFFKEMKLVHDAWEGTLHPSFDFLVGSLIDVWMNMEYISE